MQESPISSHLQGGTERRQCEWHLLEPQGAPHTTLPSHSTLWQALLKSREVTQGWGAGRTEEGYSARKGFYNCLHSHQRIPSSGSISGSFYLPDNSRLFNPVFEALSNQATVPFSFSVYSSSSHVCDISPEGPHAVLS